MSLFTSVNTTVQDINQIHEMFPTTDKEVIKTVLTANAGNKVSGCDCHTGRVTFRQIMKRGKFYVVVFITLYCV